MTAITLEHVSKRFRQDGEVVTAVDDISLRIRDGEVLAVLGPSGCGKSTLLRIIGGLLPPDSGTIYYDNIPLAEVPLRDRGIGMVFQEGALVPHWEARRSVGFFLHLRKREHEVPERVSKIAQITGIGLEKLMDRFPRQLSGGEQQRVAVARALTRDRRILLFDEPFANLDAKLRTAARIELKHLLNEFPVTSIYVTHDQTEAVALSHRIAVMRDGKFEQVGAYRYLYDSPVNLFVANFIGTPSMNLFAGIIESGRWYGETFGGYRLRSDLPDGMPVTLGIRPQHVYLDPEGEPGVVESVTPMLAERHKLIHVWLGRERWAFNAPLDVPISLGETVYCDLNEEEALYFDTQSGRRIG
jgi:multiple sugar transport system ATP-binding protein